MTENDLPLNNPQYDEIQAAKAAYIESARVKQVKQEVARVWRSMIAEQKEQGYTTEMMMQVDAESHNVIQYEEWLDLQRHLHNSIVLQKSNLFVEVGQGWPEKEFLKDEDGWRELFDNLKVALHNQTYADCVGSTLNILAKPLDWPMEYGLIGLKRKDNRYIQIRLHVGDPRKTKWRTWML